MKLTFKRFVIAFFTGFSIVAIPLQFTDRTPIFIELESETIEIPTEATESEITDYAQEYDVYIYTPVKVGSPEQTTETETEVETSETVCESQEEEETSASVEETTEEPRVIYSVDGVECDPDITDYLFSTLTEYGLSDLMDICVSQMFQESRFNPYAENTNGLDKGIYQFRTTYWEGGEIFDPYLQIDRYVSNLSRRLSKGHDIYTAISDHYSGEAWYASQYVADVCQWISKVRKGED